MPIGDCARPQGAEAVPTGDLHVRAAARSRRAFAAQELVRISKACTPLHGACIGFVVRPDTVGLRLSSVVSAVLVAHRASAGQSTLGRIEGALSLKALLSLARLGCPSAPRHGPPLGTHLLRGRLPGGRHDRGAAVACEAALRCRSSLGLVWGDQPAQRHRPRMCVLRVARRQAGAKLDKYGGQQHLVLPVLTVEEGSQTRMAAREQALVHAFVVDSGGPEANPRSDVLHAERETERLVPAALGKVKFSTPLGGRRLQLGNVAKVEATQPLLLWAAPVKVDDVKAGAEDMTGRKARAPKESASALLVRIEGSAGLTLFWLHVCARRRIHG